MGLVTTSSGKPREQMGSYSPKWTLFLISIVLELFYLYIEEAMPIVISPTWKLQKLKYPSPGIYVYYCTTPPQYLWRLVCYSVRRGTNRHLYTSCCIEI